MITRMRLLGIDLELIQQVASTLKSLYCLHKPNSKTSMNKKLWISGAAFLLLVIGLLVALTDIEVRFTRWISCGPWSSQQEDRSELCR